MTRHTSDCSKCRAASDSLRAIDAWRPYFATSSPVEPPEPRHAPDTLPVDTLDELERRLAAADGDFATVDEKRTAIARAQDAVWAAAPTLIAAARRERQMAEALREPGDKLLRECLTPGEGAAEWVTTAPSGSSS